MAGGDAHRILHTGHDDGRVAHGGGAVAHFAPAVLAPRANGAVLHHRQRMRVARADGEHAGEPGNLDREGRVRVGRRRSWRNLMTGIGPIPSCPLSPVPHAYTRPSRVSASTWSFIVETSIASNRTASGTGTFESGPQNARSSKNESGVVPSLPLPPLMPQARSVPSARTANEHATPACGGDDSGQSPALSRACRAGAIPCGPRPRMASSPFNAPSVPDLHRAVGLDQEPVTGVERRHGVCAVARVCARDERRLRGQRRREKKRERLDADSSSSWRDFLQPRFRRGAGCLGGLGSGEHGQLPRHRFRAVRRRDELHAVGAVGQTNDARREVGVGGVVRKPRSRRATIWFGSAGNLTSNSLACALSCAFRSASPASMTFWVRARVSAICFSCSFICASNFSRSAGGSFSSNLAHHLLVRFHLGRLSLRRRPRAFVDRICVFPELRVGRLERRRVDVRLGPGKERRGRGTSRRRRELVERAVTQDGNVAAPVGDRLCDFISLNTKSRAEASVRPS